MICFLKRKEKYLFPFRFKQMIEIITFVETRRADSALIKLKSYFSIKSKFYTCIFSNTHMC